MFHEGFFSLKLNTCQLKMTDSSINSRHPRLGNEVNPVDMTWKKLGMIISFSISPSYLLATQKLFCLPLSKLFFIKLFFFFNGRTYGIQKFPGQGLNPRLHSDLSCCSQILNPLCHGGNSKYNLKTFFFFSFLLEIIYRLFPHIDLVHFPDSSGTFQKLPTSTQK